MFCDQDDVWLPDKIALTMKQMGLAEKRYGKDMAILVHTDLCVVDKDLCTINPSFFRMRQIDPYRNKLNNLLVVNTVSGCTMLFNKALLDLIKIPLKNALMHDSWIAMIAAAFGEIIVLEEATLKYRQHNNNSCGVKSVGTCEYYYRKFKEIIFDTHHIRKGLITQYHNASEFKKLYEETLSKKQNKMLDCYSRFDSMNPFQRLFYMQKYDFFMNGVVRKIGQLLI